MIKNNNDHAETEIYQRGSNSNSLDKLAQLSRADLWAGGLQYPAQYRSGGYCSSIGYCIAPRVCSLFKGRLGSHQG